ncbi:MAG TPA: hypothetical protein VN698_03885 [Bacteroidia bacterium]|nr:hypothetical protein [Bacteroidia bacterium]
MKIKIPYYSKTSYLIIGCFIFFTACKAKQTTSTTNVNETTNAIKTQGIVSHKYKTQGCETIIICASANTDTLFLIPTPPLQNFDIEGLKISFTYHTLRVHNPKGCHQGIPAQISNIKAN